MLYAIISDIHGNLEAFQSVLKELDKLTPDKYLFLGDLVGYCANPNECADLFSELNYLAVMGNHDYTVLNMVHTEFFNPHARQAIKWTADNISSKTRDMLNSFEMKIENDDFTLVHANPTYPLGWAYISSLKDAEFNFGSFLSRICFVAHSHVPWIVGISPDKNVKVIEKKETYNYKLKKDWRYIINAGSVGQPRDHDHRACYLLWDSDKDLLSINRIEYDIDLAQKKIVDADLPPILAERLRLGA